MQLFILLQFTSRIFFSKVVDKIIERDFFPHLTKLQLQTEYLDALSSNDVEKLRQIELKLDRSISTRKFNGIYYLWHLVLYCLLIFRLKTSSCLILSRKLAN